MNVYEFLSSLGFWQWVGVIILAALAVEALANVATAILGAFRRKP